MDGPRILLLRGRSTLTTAGLTFAVAGGVLKGTTEHDQGTEAFIDSIVVDPSARIRSFAIKLSTIERDFVAVEQSTESLPKPRTIYFCLR